MEPGNETGYIVGMTTCYPQPGTVKIGNGESLTIVSNYSSHQSHTGVMGLFYILVADPVPESHSFLHSQIKVRFSPSHMQISYSRELLSLTVI